MTNLTRSNLIDPAEIEVGGKLPEICLARHASHRKSVSERSALCLVGITLLAICGSVAGQSTSVSTGSKAIDSEASASNLQQHQAQTPPSTSLMHIVPFGPPRKRPAAPRGAASEPVLPYWGGPVISNIHVVEVFWGSFVDSGSTTGLQQYFTDVTNSNYFDLLSEYGTVNVTGQGGAPGSNQLIGRGAFDGKFVITPSLCPGSAAATPPTCSLTDAQIQNELVNQLSNLPAPVTDAQGNFNTIYLIYFPPGVQITIGKSQSCMGGGFCAYHSSLGLNSRTGLPYGVFPDFGPTSGCSAANQGCGSSTAFNNLTAVSSHELGEAATDVDVSNATTFAPPLAWFSNLTGEELGDICTQQQAQITAGSNTYTVQKLWSNMQNACVTAPAQYRLATATNAIPGKPFNLTVTVMGNNGVATAYANTVHFTSSDAQAVLPADYTFVPATDAGLHTFSVTLKSLNSQSITATDILAAPITATADVSVNHNPDLAIAGTHTGNFRQGQTGAAYQIAISNDGDLPTTGSVTVTDSLPSDLTATAMSGTGWTCTLSTLTCTRSDVLAAGAAYPLIILTVNVSDVAQAFVTNAATVSGGGEVNTFNDTSNDNTAITQLPDLAITKTHSGSFSQGQTGAIYTLTVSNAGNASTVGLVTTKDALPVGLVAAAIGGTGWTCALNTLTCTRSDVQAAGGSYPPITLVVKVASNAATSLTNSATVSGGGEVNTANDTANDVTSITQPSPDLVIASTHSGNFIQGQTGATYALIVSNIGPVASSGTVTATDNVPTYLTATAISGSGWTCDLPTVTCTRSDPLAAGPNSSYPPITLTVTVSSVSGLSLTNAAVVSGGGELDTTNDSATDPTTITGWPDLVVNLSHNGNFAQGETGATYSLTVINNGAAPTFGTVSATDALPTGLTPTDISGSGWTCTLATLTCTRNDPLISFYPVITVTVNVASNAQSSITNMVTVSGGGEINTTDNKASDPTQILPPVSISLEGENGTVKAGNAAAFSFSVFSTPSGTVTLSCSKLPANAACIFTPSTVAGSSTGPSFVNLSITTQAPSAAALRPSLPDHKAPLYQLTFAMLGLAVTLSHRKRRKARFLATFTVLLFLAGCGGGSNTSSPPPPVGGTPIGAYTITVTANNNSANLQASTPITLTVQ